MLSKPFLTRLSAIVAVCLCSLAAPAAAHEIPNDVTVQTFFKPEGQRLRLLLRVPLVAMRDMDFPKRAGARSSDMLDLSRAEKTLRDAATLWIADFLDVYENDRKLPYPKVVEVRASLQSDRSFTSYEDALAHVTGPRLAADMEYPWSQGLLDVMFEFPIQSDRDRFSINPRFGRLGIHTLTVLRFLPPGGAVRAFELPGDPGIVHLDPSWFQAAFQFVKLGFEHILDGTDHLLFLLCLVIPFRRPKPLLAVITAFTVAHSIPLFASAYNLAPDALWFPPLIETLIAASIVYMALENIVGASVQRRWLITFGFGLVHGFGFSFALRQTLQFAGAHLLTSLFSFNVGVELGQMLVLAFALPALALLFRFVVEERMGTIILSAIVAHTAWHWLADRYATLRQYRIEWPTVDALFVVSLLRWAMIVVAAAGAWWLVTVLRQSRAAHESVVQPFRAADDPQA